MSIVIDKNLLEKQIKLCDTYSVNTSNDNEKELFEGIANLLSEINYELEKPVQKLYSYDICNDEKGIIIANTIEEAAELFREHKPNTKYALGSDPDWEKRVKIYQDGGAMIDEVTELNGVSKICCTVDW